MGTLVFQATLGGSVNLIGPNTASTINFTLPSADGSSGQALVTNGSGTLSFSSVTTSPGGSTTQVQYNNAGVFAGSANFTFDGTTVTHANDTYANGVRIGRGAGAVATNTAVGASALATNSGAYNSAFGYQALQANTSGNYNQAFGNSALLVNTTGSSNSSMGQGALGANTTGSNNSAFGYYALVSNTTASNNTAVGYQAGYSNTTGYDICAFGVGALYANTTGVGNNAFGRYSLQTNTTGIQNSGFGHATLYLNTTGTNNTATGYQALFNNTTASSNTAVGYQALYANTTGVNSTAIGYQALYNQTTAGALGWNTACGLGALSGVTTGYYNIALGGNAGNNLTTGNNCIFLGTFAQASSSSAQNETVFAGLTGKGNNTTYIGGSSGAYNQANSATWSITSDQRLKKNIVNNDVGLEKITQIQVRNFEYRLPEEVTDLPQEQTIDKKGVQLGVIAQELQAVLPDCVKTQSTGVLTVDTDNLTWYFVNAIKQLKAEIDQLKGN